MGSKRIKLLFIYNPISGKGKSKQVVEKLPDYFDENEYEIHIELITAPGHGSEIALANLDKGFDAIVAVGGDGTLNEIGKELIETDIPLGIIPTGSGNGLARHLGIPMNFKKSIAVLKSRHIVKIDTAQLNDIPFLNVAGIGFDAIVSEAFSKSKKRGMMNYIKLIMKHWKNRKMYKISYQIENEKKETSFTLISFANSAQYGNEAKIAPRADIQDGKIDVCILKKINLFQTLGFAFSTMTSRLKTNEYFETFTTSNFEGICNVQLAHVDGDPVAIEQSIKIKVLPKSLNVICRA